MVGSALAMTTHSRRSTTVAALVLIALSFATRLPALLNAAGTNSDAAIVGLQARHILHGHQWSPFLWGSGYQTSADSTWAALFFAVFGPTPLALMLSALVLHVALTLFAFFTLRRHTEPWRAFVATLPLVFTTACVHSYALYPPRQLALTLAFAAFFAIDAASVVSLAIGGLLAMLAWVADPYAMIFLPAALVLAFVSVMRSRDELGPRARALGAFFGGATLGTVVLALLFSRPEAQHGVTSMSAGVLSHNWKLFAHECLPWAIGTKVYKPLHVMDYVAWKMPRAYAIVAWASAASLAGALLASAYFALFTFEGRRPSSTPDSRTAPLRSALLGVRALAAIAWLTIVLNVTSFLVSLMVMDHFSMRYLAASILMLPFALAPLVDRLGAAKSAALLAPYLFVAGAGGWLAHGDWVRGPLPQRTDAGRGVVEARVLSALRERKVEAAIADYWASYRLDLLWREEIPVVPYHASQDRYPPYRAKYAAAKRVAYIHDRDRSFEDENAAIAEMSAEGTIRDRFTWEGFDVIVIERATSR